MKPKTIAQCYIESRLRELEDPRYAGKIAYQQELLSLRRLEEAMHGAGEWVEAADDDRPNSPEDIGGRGRPGGWTGGRPRG